MPTSPALQVQSSKDPRKLWQQATGIQKKSLTQVMRVRYCCEILLQTFKGEITLVFHYIHYSPCELINDILLYAFANCTAALS